MRTTTGTEDTRLSGPTYQVSRRVKVANGSGTMKDWSSWVETIDTDENIDQPVEQLDITFRRDFGVTLSLNPLKTDSTLNVLDDNVTFSPAIDAGRAITWETATTPIGTAPVSGDWKLLFTGTIDDLDFESSPMKAVCRDQGGDIVDAWVETEVAYPALSSLEAGIQRLLDARFGAGVIPLNTPVSPSYVLNQYGQVVQSLATAVETLEQLIGWDVRYLWDNGSNSYKYTLWDPGRSKVTPDYTFGPSRILAVHKLGFQKRSVRNVIIVSYKDSASGARQTITVSDATSISRYKRQVMLITEPDDSPISSSTQATTMANTALADLKDPKAEFEIEMHHWWPAMLNDLYRFTANIRWFNTNQDWAVVGIKHHISMGQHRTTLTVRGKPTGGYDSWLNRGAPAPKPTPVPNVPDYHGMFFSETFEKTPLENGWFPATANTNGTLVAAVGASAVGKNVYQATAYEWWTAPVMLPFNPSKLYRARVRYRCTVNPGTAGTRLIYIGLQCFDSTGAAANNNAGYCYIAASGVSVNVAAGWVEQTFWFKGATSAFGSGSTGTSADPVAPSTLSVNTTLVRPQLALNYPSGGTTDGTFQLDYYCIEEFDEDLSFRAYNVLDILGRLKRAKPHDDGDYTVRGITTDGLVMKAGVLQDSAGHSRPLGKGFQSGWTVDGGAVSFNPIFQSVPVIFLTGGKAANGTFLYDDFAAESSTASGFNCRAKNKSKGTITIVNEEFTSPLTQSTPGSVVGAATLNSAPASDNNYKARFKLTVVCTTTNPGPVGGMTTAVVAIEASADGGTNWTEYATYSRAASRTSYGTTTDVFDQQEVTINVTGLSASAPADKIRLKLKSVTVSTGATGSATVEGFDNSPGAEGHGVVYTTAAGGSTQTKTPDPDDSIFWEAWEKDT